MVEDELNKFDLQIRSMMESAEEEAPSRVWDAINSSLPRKRKVFAPAWLGYTGIAFAAIASVLVTLTVTGTFKHSSINILPEQNNTARVAEIAAPPIVESEADELNVKEPGKVAPSNIRKTGKVTKPENIVDIIAPVQENMDEELYVADLPDDRTTGKESADMDQKGIEIKDMSKEEWDAYFGDEPYKKKIAGKAVLDVKGLFGSNDGVSQKSILSTVWAAPVKDNIYTTGVSETSTSVYAVPVTFGLGARFYVTDRFSIGTGLNYSILSRSFRGDFIKADANGAKIMSIKNADVVNRQNYIGIPVNLYYDFLQTDLIQFYGFGGATFEKGLSNTYSISAEEGSEKFKSDISGIQSSIAAGLGIQFKVSDNWGVFIDPSARYYFDCKQPASVRTAKPLMFHFEIGARININKR